VGAIMGAARWPYTMPVATVSPGKFGLYDMAGNVWDVDRQPVLPLRPPWMRRPSSGRPRGGSWSMADFVSVRLTDRSPTDPSNTRTNVGFRCARNVSSP
jgi:formylglycine-generating enzyme required for sulfatase activity